MGFHRNIIDAIRTEAYKFNSSVPQIEVLHCVVDKKNPTMKDIAEYLKVKPPSVTSVVESLFEKGLLKKIVDKKDNRITRVIVTQKALKMFLKIKNKKGIVIKKMFQELSPKDKKEFKKILLILSK